MTQTGAQKAQENQKEKEEELRQLFLTLGEQAQESALHLLRSLYFAQADKSSQGLSEIQPACTKIKNSPAIFYKS